MGETTEDNGDDAAAAAVESDIAQHSRKLSQEETAYLTEHIGKLLMSPDEDQEIISDSIKYICAMIQSGKSVQDHIIDELVNMSISDKEKATEIGAIIQDFLDKGMKNGSSSEVVAEESTTAATTGKGNALTMSGALGSARRGEEKPKQNALQMAGALGSSSKGSGKQDNQKQKQKQKEKRDGDETGRKETRSCFNCGAVGHVTKECNAPRQPKQLGRNWGGRGGKKTPVNNRFVDKKCHKCDQLGHISKDCTAGSKNESGTGGRDKSNKKCRNCGGMGHIAADCTSSGSDKKGQSKTCHNCGQVGHIAPECRAPRQARGGGEKKCFNCGNIGHTAAECNAPPGRNNGGRGFGGGGGGGRGMGSPFGGRGGRGAGRGVPENDTDGGFSKKRSRQSEAFDRLAKQQKTNENGEQKESAAGDGEQEEWKGGDYEQFDEQGGLGGHISGGRWGGRGGFGGRFHRGGRGGRGRGGRSPASYTWVRGQQQSGEADAESKEIGAAAAENGEGNVGTDQAENHPSPMVQAAYSGGGYRGRGYRGRGGRGGRGYGGRGGYYNVASQVASKKWVRQQPASQENSGGAAAGGGNEGGGEG